MKSLTTRYWGIVQTALVSCCQNLFPGKCERYIWQLCEILTFPKAEFFLTQGIFYHYLDCSSYSQQTFNLYPEGSLMKKDLKLYMLCS